jgi:hypothetical protein
MRWSSCCSPWPTSACRAPAGFVGEFLTLMGGFQVNTWVAAVRHHGCDPVGGLCAVALSPGDLVRGQRGDDKFEFPILILLAALAWA